ncbi:hypothetical protein JW897_22455 [Chromobacterium alkanivorans]|uniref:hypothetical protein n=1 Tax=Chromobacterium alkanivorans TaxID=1071719 RepID=UPI00196773A9|nr:hypothetical protein [Chromobacterium alkanivorans]MBN3006508.1 hypothetical protein [Chromobacterium alkanivorans]
MALILFMHSLPGSEDGENPRGGRCLAAMRPTVDKALEPVQNLASKSETRRKRLRKRNVRVVHEHFEEVFNAVSPQRSRL